MTPALLALAAALAAAAPVAGTPAAPAAAEPASPQPVRRFALVAGANDGGRARPRLRYAVKDARRFAAVLEELGGVAPADALVVVEPTEATLRAAFDAVRDRVRAARGGGRVELVFYYSGHSDEHGLLLGPGTLPYPAIRRWLDEVGADVRIAVLDSCSSGALTRSKGGVRAPSFLLDGSTRVTGHAILTSSAADEASQESDRIEASFFTHALVTGLRGAADGSLDGRVTLSEAYQFAFQETLARTERSRGGPQHPGFDIELAGSGDVVMTDLRGAGARLVLPDAIAGRFFVRDRGERLVAELLKFPGRPVELSLAPGDYRVVRADGHALSEARLALAPGGKAELATAAFVAAPRELTAMRGDGTEYALVPVDFSVFPPLSTNGDRTTINRLQLGLIASRTTRLRGVGFAPVIWAEEDVVGAQVSAVGTSARGPVLGLQLSGTASVAHAGLEGAQLAGALGVVFGDARGVQGAYGATWTGGRITGIQGAGAFAFARAVKGGQLAAVAAARELRGAQVGVAAIAEDVSGAQVSVLNYATDVRGAQIGVVNLARNVRGLQLGVVNLSDDVDGVPVGIVNLVRNGEQRFTALVDEDGTPRGELLLGSRRFHSVFTGALERSGAGAGRGRAWAGFGLGTHHVRGRLFLDVDLLGERAMDEDAPHVRATARALFGWRLAPRAALVAGPTANVLLSFDEAFAPGTGGGAGRDVRWFGADHGRAWAGLVAGLRL